MTPALQTDLGYNKKKIEEMEVSFGVVQEGMRRADTAQHDAVRSLCLYGAPLISPASS